jgi:predicted dehydrogenase/putative sterol carrier protein
MSESNQDFIGVGFIGLGRIADMHFPGYSDIDNAGVVAVCDINEALCQQRMKEYGIQRYYTDYLKMLADPDIQAVEILSPHHLHEPMVLAAAEAGKHIALQKPMANTLESADRMLEAVKKAGVVFRVSDNYVYYPPVIKAREMIDAGVIGEPSNLSIKLISGGTGGWEISPDTWAWRVKETREGRGLQTFDHGHHLWTTAWYLLGEMERVTSWIDSADGVVDCPAVMMWRYRDGVKYGICEYSYSMDMKLPSKYYSNDEWFQVVGSKGIILIHRCTGNLLEGPVLSLYDGEKWEHFEDPDCDWGDGFKGATRNFISAIRGEEPPLLSGEQARQILRSTIAISKSSRVRREVYVDELDASWPWYYTWKKIRQEKAAQGEKKGILALLGLGGKDAKYAGQAIDLTKALLDRFDADAVSGWSSEIGLVLLPEGDVEETKFHLSIQDGQTELHENLLPENPDLVVKVPAGTWAAILLKKKRLETAFLTGRLKLEGQADQGLKLRQAFGI